MSSRSKVVALAIALLCASCQSVSSPATLSPIVEAPPVAPALRARRGGTDVTFLAISDTHVGNGYPEDLSQLSADPRTKPVGLERENLALISAMNTIEGKAYPPPLSGVVGRPRGVLAAGDLTEWGRPEEWQRWVAIYGRTGVEGTLELPVFEAVGNHDKVRGPWIEGEVAKRHGGRHYAWNWGDLHVASLGDGPDDPGLAWLERDLGALERDVPVVLYFHFPVEGPFSTDNWFGQGNFRDRLATLLAGRNVIGIFHGHHHATGSYRWNGIDLYYAGSVKDGPHLFTVVHVTDASMSVARYDFDARGWSAASEKSLAPPREPPKR